MIGKTRVRKSHASRSGRHAVLLAAMLTLPAPLASQVVRGSVVERGTARPLPLASVALVDSSLAVVRQVVTDEDGTFVIEAPSPGEYYVVANQLGYEDTADGPLELVEDETHEVELVLRPEPLELDALIASIDRGRTTRDLEATGFYQRMGDGFGYFITPEQLEERPPNNARDLFRSVPSVTIRDNGVRGQALMLRRGGNCTPTLFVDGVRSTPNSGVPGIVLRDIVNVLDIAAVEVYSGPATVPMQFRSVSNTCGAVLAWTW